MGQNQKNYNHSKNFAHDNSLHSLVDIGPDCRQTGLEADNRNRNENRSHVSHKSMVRIVVVEDGLQHLENLLTSRS
ncbi:hypothetical protein Tco_1124912 [Tanacetum coccineum]|uniref:Uncharacterized protein n=1 Tax=Tanacetum coccineum TaxID=301880 RepID=A0ABQ5J7G8_9ASTR